MSLPLYHNIGGLRFWDDWEIELREMMVPIFARAVRDPLMTMNRAWSFYRMEGPILTPRSFVSPAYDGDDIWLLRAGLAEDEAVLRAETTPSSYEYVRFLMSRARNVKPPLCVWQVGKSFRRETSDGANWGGELRAMEFYQQEFQCVFANTTKADYRSPVIQNLRVAVERYAPTRVVVSDRLPAYSQSTLDIECHWNGKWKEIASVSLRTDFSDEHTVLEVAIGLDRMVTIALDRDAARRADVSA